MSSNKTTTTCAIDALIQFGECEWLEFKMGVLFRNSVLLDKVSYFVKNSGGILLIGISDDGLVVGLEGEYRLLQEQHAEFFSLQKNRVFWICYRNYLKHILSLNLGADIESDIQIDKVVINNKEVCVINVGQFLIGNEQMPALHTGCLPRSERILNMVETASITSELQQIKQDQNKAKLNAKLKRRGSFEGLDLSDDINTSSIVSQTHKTKTHEQTRVIRDFIDKNAESIMDEYLDNKKKRCPKNVLASHLKNKLFESEKITINADSIRKNYLNDWPYGQENI